MDPNQKPPLRPQPRTGYISDFVAPQQAMTPADSQPTPQPQPVASPAPTLPVTPAPASAMATTPTPQAPQSVKPVKSHQGLRDVLSIFGVLASALLLAFCLITFVFQSYQVDGPSMQTTLENNDHLIVWKVSKTIANATGGSYIPNRGDVIVFNENSSGTEDKQLIKRVIARPGERVTVKDGLTTVYTDEYPNGFNPDKTLPYGSVITDTPGNSDVTLKENQVFVMGDNRTNSLDSRVFGPIEADQIVGKLVLRVLPLNSVTKF